MSGCLPTVLAGCGTATTPAPSSFRTSTNQLALQEDKTAIFEEWCSFLNFFDSSVHFEFSFVNMAADAESFERSIRIPPQKDGFDDIRAEYSQMLKTQLAQGNNGLTKTKYLTFGIEAASMRQAKPRLDHLQNDILNNFRRLGAAARVLNGLGAAAPHARPVPHGW